MTGVFAEPYRRTADTLSAHLFRFARGRAIGDTVPYQPIFSRARKGSCHDKAGARRIDRCLKPAAAGRWRSGAACEVGLQRPADGAGNANAPLPDARSRSWPKAAPSSSSGIATATARSIPVELSNKALLLEVPKKPGRARFDVVTPQAIAAVRGTKWAVDAEGAKTSVFVVDGRVSVARPAGRGSVVLGAGDGVDVEPSGDLIVKRWPPARVTALMARLGQ